MLLEIKLFMVEYGTSMLDSDNEYESTFIVYKLNWVGTADFCYPNYFYVLNLSPICASSALTCTFPSSIICINRNKYI